MKKFIKYLSTIIMFFILTILLVSSFIKNDDYRFISFGYVYSGSMEPTIMTNDGYILIHAKNYNVNDIITFKPSVLKQNYITHRIINTTEDNKFITKGDNNSISDQKFGEPSVSSNQILGKVFTIKNRPVIIPNLGFIVAEINPIVRKLNIFIIISICMGVYVITYVYKIILSHNKLSKRKHICLKDIALYLDPVFIILCIMIIFNSVIIGTTTKSWDHDEFNYIVTTTKGISSPLPGEKFVKNISFKNATIIPFLVILEPVKQSNKVTPDKLYLSYNQIIEYSCIITAPNEIGMHTDLVIKRTYPNILPEKWFDFFYSKNKILPLIVIFLPGIILNLVLFIWWTMRWKLGNRKIMGWMITVRSMIKRLT